MNDHDFADPASCHCDPVRIADMWAHRDAAISANTAYVVPLDAAGEPVPDEWESIGTTRDPVAIPSVGDTLARIDEAVGPRCAYCQGPLRPDGPSADFCSEACQNRWYYQQGGGQLPDGGPYFESASAALNFSVGQIAEHFASVARAITEAWSAAFASAGLPRVVLSVGNPDDPSIMERALLARRQRNTGPATRNWPPRNIGYEATAPVVAPPTGHRRPRG